MSFPVIRDSRVGSRRMSMNPRLGPARQRGITTLAIAMLLLAVLTVAAIFAASFGVFEQRTSANEYRYKLVFQSAEAGLNQGVAFMKVSARQMVSTSSGGWLEPGSEKWIPCTDPLPSTMAFDPCLAEPVSRRSLMFRYAGSLPLSEVLPNGASQTFASTGGAANFATEYRVYATLCRRDTSVSPTECSLAPPKPDTFFITLVSRGQIVGESADAIVKQSFGAYRSFGRGPDAPLIAAGTSIGMGNAQIVPNPDAAGVGVPVSVWARGNATINAGASFATCQLGEWLDNYGVNAPPTPQQLLDGVCLTCSCNNLCPGYGLVSGAATGCANGTPRLEGEDVLDVDGGISDAGLVDSKYFPPDLFAYVFGTPSASAEDYLTRQATPLDDCSTLNAASAGLYWYRGADDCTLAGQIGSLAEPVVLVSDAPIRINANGVVYGVLYARAVSGATDLFTATGSPQIYGSVVLEGGANMAGTPSIIYNKAVIQNILNSPQFLLLAPVAGSWSDDVARE